MYALEEPSSNVIVETTVVVPVFWMTREDERLLDELELPPGIETVLDGLY